MSECIALRYASGRLEELEFGLPGTNETYFESLNITHAYYDDCLDRFCDSITALEQQVSDQTRPMTRVDLNILCLR